jgi:hypothetical protein
MLDDLGLGAAKLLVTKDGSQNVTGIGHGAVLVGLENSGNGPCRAANNRLIDAGVTGVSSERPKKPGNAVGWRLTAERHVTKHVFANFRVQE